MNARSTARLASEDVAAPARAPRGLGLLVFLAPFCLYLKTMAPTVYGLDSAELTTGAWTLGIVHSPGSPLFLMVAHLFCYLPLGDVGWRVNLLSVVSGALLAVFVYAILRRLTGRAWIGVVAAWSLATSYYVWVWAVVAELYAPHLCFAAALLWLVLRWSDTRRDGWLWTAGGVAGLGLGNHTSLVLLAPGLAWLVLATDPTLWRQPRRWLPAFLVGSAACVGVFLYFPIRQAAHPALDYVRDYFPHVNLASPEGLLWMIRGGMFESLFFDVPRHELGDRGARFAEQMLANFGVLPIGIALVGLAAACVGARDRRHFAIVGLLLFFCHAVFFIAYGALDSDWMYSVNYLLTSLFFGLGLGTLADRLPPAVQGRPTLALPALVALLVAVQTVFNFPYVNLSRDSSARDLGQRILAILPPESLFIGMWEHEPILQYLRLVEGQRPDVRVVNGVFTGSTGAQQLARQAHHAGRPVYTTATNLFDPAAFDCRYVAEGACYRVWPPKASGQHF